MAFILKKNENVQVSADVINNVLDDLLGEDHELKTERKRKHQKCDDNKKKRKSSRLGNNKETFDVRLLQPRPKQVNFLDLDVISCSESLRHSLTEWTMQPCLTVDSFSHLAEGCGRFVARISFPCKSIEQLDGWMDTFERVTETRLRTKTVEFMPKSPTSDVFYRAKWKCACSSVVYREAIDLCESECVSRDVTESKKCLIPCSAYVRTTLMREGLAHVTLFHNHNHKNTSSPNINYNKDESGTLSEEMKNLILDLFKTDMTPTQVLDLFLKHCHSKSAATESRRKDSRQRVERDGIIRTCDAVKYHHIYDLFEAFKRHKGRDDVRVRSGDGDVTDCTKRDTESQFDDCLKQQPVLQNSIPIKLSDQQEMLSTDSPPPCHISRRVPKHTPPLPDHNVVVLSESNEYSEDECVDIVRDERIGSRNNHRHKVVRSIYKQPITTSFHQHLGYDNEDSGGYIGNEPDHQFQSRNVYNGSEYGKDFPHEYIVIEDNDEQRMNTTHQQQLLSSPRTSLARKLLTDSITSCNEDLFRQQPNQFTWENRTPRKSSNRRTNFVTPTRAHHNIAYFTLNDISPVNQISQSINSDFEDSTSQMLTCGSPPSLEDLLRTPRESSSETLFISTIFNTPTSSPGYSHFMNNHEEVIQSHDLNEVNS